MIEQELFIDALLRERRRADRFNQPFLLLLVSIKESVGAESVLTWAAVSESVASVSRPMDVLGWLEQGSVLGLILPQIDAPDVPPTRRVDARLRRELASRVEPGTASKCTIQLHAYTGVNPGVALDGGPTEPLLSTVRRDESRTSVRNAIKRGLDILGSLTLLALLAPLFLIIAALVKLTSAGPVIFRQVRVGQSAKPFTMLKFRTMRAHADQAIHQQYVTQFIKSDGPVSGSRRDAVFKIVNDPRLTPIGHWLRRTSLDELPQFWNVVRGEMSLVGPRPPLPYEVEQYKRWHRRRVLEAKPGITGLWQVTGRSRTSFEDMVRLDLRYARTCSVWNDIKILLATPRAVITGKGAC